MKNKYIQIIGFLIVVVAIWYFLGPKSAAVTAIIVAILEFWKPSN